MTAEYPDTWDEERLQSLIDNQVRESRQIEYKEKLPGPSGADRREFLADVSSFANSSGGHIIYGMKSNSGLPIEPCDVGEENLDAVTLRLENLARDGIDPRIPGLSIRPVPLQKGGHAVVIWIPRSWAAPHMVTLEGLSRFYGRNSAGKYQLDVSELRGAFVASETGQEKLRRFRLERIALIEAGETPAPLSGGPRLVLHIVPFGAIQGVSAYDVASLASIPNEIRPLYDNGWSSRHNFDGFLTYTGEPEATSYVQVFRDGTIEAVDTRILEGKQYIPSILYEQQLMDRLSKYLDIQRRLGVTMPVIVMLSLIGVKGYTMGVDPGRFFNASLRPIDRDVLLVPEIVIEEFNIDPSQTLKPAFDSIWNAAGWSGSMNYNDAGKWVGR